MGVGGGGSCVPYLRGVLRQNRSSPPRPAPPCRHQFEVSGAHGLLGPATIIARSKMCWDHRIVMDEV
jgi:hypothetical protein